MCVFTRSLATRGLVAVAVMTKTFSASLIGANSILATVELVNGLFFRTQNRLAFSQPPAHCVLQDQKVIGVLFLFE